MKEALTTFCSQILEISSGDGQLSESEMNSIQPTLPDQLTVTAHATLALAPIFG